MATPYSTSSVRPGRSGMEPWQSNSLIGSLYRCVCLLSDVEARNDREHPVFGRHRHAVSIRRTSILSKTAAIKHRGQYLGLE